MYGGTKARTHPHDRVARVMAWPVATVPEDASLLEVAEALTADEVGALCVIGDGHLVAGIVSIRDVVGVLVDATAGIGPA